MRIAIMRHGATVFNEEHRYAGWTDIPLSELGERQAVKAGVCPDVRKVYVSTLQRSQRTAALCFPNAQQVVVEDVKEMNFGDFEGRTANEMADDADYRAWVESWCKIQCPNGEDHERLIARVSRALRQIVDEARASGETHVIVVAHGGTIMAAMDGLSDDDRDYFDWQVGNCEGYCADVEIDGDSLRLLNPQRFSDLAFLDESEWAGQCACEGGSPDWRQPHCFFQNRECRYFPCHEGVREDEFNCLFCYCPLYALGPRCGGNFVYTEKGRKNCKHCALPHIRANGSKMVAAHFEELADLARLQPSEGVS